MKLAGRLLTGVKASVLALGATTSLLCSSVFAASLGETTLIPGSGQHVINDPHFNYALYIPEDYQQDPNKKYPLIVAMTGIGGNVLNVNHTEVLPLSAPKGERTLKGFHRQFVGNGLNQENYQAIVVSPNCNVPGRSGTCWYNPTRINNMVSSLLDTLPVDPERVFLTGQSGGAQTSMLAAMNIAPDRYAGILPIAFKPLSKKALGGDLCKYQELHIWSWGGANDRSHHPNSWGKGFERAVKADCGDSVLDNFQLSIVADGGHNDRTWNTAYASAEVHGWFLTKTRLQVPGRPNVTVNEDFAVNELAGEFTLQAQATDEDGTIESVVWTQIAGPEAIISFPSAPQTDITGLQPGELTFEVTATDNDDKQASAKVNVTVLSADENLPPEITVATIHRIYLPEDSISITANITDADGIVDVVWQQISGTSALYTGEQTNTLSLSGLSEGSYEFSLTATDVYGLSATTIVAIHVDSSNPDDLVNVALGKPTTATAEQTLNNVGTFFASFATDGQVGPKDTPWAPGAVFGERYLEIDLMDSYNIESATVYSGYNNKRAIKNFSLHAFANGQWSPIDGGSLQNGGDLDTEVSLFFTPIDAVEKIRFYCEDPRKDNCRLRELEVYSRN